MRTVLLGGFVVGLTSAVAAFVGCSSSGSDSNSETPSDDGGQGKDSAVVSDSGPHGSGLNLPLITPPIRAAAPVGLGGTAHSGKAPIPPSHPLPFDLAASDIKTRFFQPGPTYVYGILQTVDDRLTDLNGMLQNSTASCAGQTPVEYTITLAGVDTKFYGQCVQDFGTSTNGHDFLQFGQHDGATYIYALIGAGPVAAIVTPAAGGADAGGGATGYRVEVWAAVGRASDRSGSYGPMHILADTTTLTFEMAVAGLGVGYCGVQFQSDGTNVYGIGSADMGTVCDAVDTFCLAAVDMSTAGTCAAPLTTFALTPLGRMETTAPFQGNPSLRGASNYPGDADAGVANNVNLDGTAGDSIHLGPEEPTPGLGNIQGGASDASTD